MRDHDPYRIVNFGGLYDRGEDEVCPVDHLQKCLNMRFLPRGVATRHGTIKDGFLSTEIRRIYIYRVPGQAQRLLLLNNNGDIYDSTNLSVVILHVPGMLDFAAVTMFGRVYISPHNGLTGLPGEKVYVYTGSGFARPAAGSVPSGFNLTVANSAISGSIEGGDHIFAVAYESNSGFITGYGGFAKLTATGGFKADISSIPLGDSWVVARHIVATKVIDDFNGDFINQTYYYVPNGRIPNNIAVSITVDFFDADLQDEASASAEQLAILPAGVTLENYNGRLIIGGEDANQSTIRVSAVGEPESINSVEGLANVNPGDAGSGIRNLWVHRESLCISKDRRSYYVIDSGDEAAFWKPIPLDMSVGAESHSVGQVLDYGQTLKDIVFIGDRDGLYLYNGVFSSVPISQKIEDVWGRINKAFFHNVEIAIDSVGSFGYCAVPLDGATRPNYVLHFDYNNGLNPEDIRWSIWKFAGELPQSVVVDTNPNTKESVFKFGAYAGNIMKMDETARNDNGLLIEQYIEFAFMPHEADTDKSEGDYHLGGIQVAAKGVGDLMISVRSQDNVVTGSGVPIALVMNPGREIFRLLDFTAPRFAVRLELTEINDFLILKKYTQFMSWVWSGEFNQFVPVSP